MHSFNTTPTLRLVQITDTHLYGNKDGKLVGMATQHSMECVLELVQQQQPKIDALLVTGDLSQDGSLESYQFLQQALQRFDCPSFWLNGNHDNPQSMKQVDQSERHLQTLLRTPHWQVVLLNSQVEGSVLGYLAADQLQHLEQVLSERPDLHTLITFHHHPIPMNSRWMDTIGIENADELLALIARFPNVKGVLWGHVHQTSDSVRQGVRFLSSPSTCIQFKPLSQEFALDNEAPGYRWLELHEDGRIETGVERVQDVDFQIDHSSTGY